MDNFLPDLIMHLLNFLIIFVIVNVLVYKPIAKFMAARTERVKAEMDAAEASQRDAEALRADYQQKLDNSKREAAQIMEKSEQQAKEAEEKTVAKAKERASQIIKSAREQIDAERQTAVEQMRDEFATLAVQIASKVLEREVSVHDNQAVIDEFFDKVG